MADPVVIRLPPVWSRAERYLAIAAGALALAFVVSITVALWGVVHHDTAQDAAHQRAALHEMLEQTFADMAVRIADRSGPDGAPADTWPQAVLPRS